MTDEFDENDSPFGVPLAPAGGYWRAGRHNPHTVYLQLGPGADGGDMPIGYFNVPQMRDLAVESVNTRYEVSARLSLAEELLKETLEAVDADLRGQIETFLWRGEAYPIYPEGGDNGVPPVGS